MQKVDRFFCKGAYFKSFIFADKGGLYVTRCIIFNNRKIDILHTKKI